MARIRKPTEPQRHMLYQLARRDGAAPRGSFPTIGGASTWDAIVRAGWATVDDAYTYTLTLDGWDAIELEAPILDENDPTCVQPFAMPDGTPFSRYAWLITRDRLAKKNEKGDAGMSGPHNAPPGLLRRLEKGEGHAFNLYDDDGNHYYEGRLLAAKGADPVDFCAAPLDDFGTGWAGCTLVRWTGHSGWDVG